ncbi:MAG: glycosyltransferase family 39 protein [Acidobacteriia bacterium]|nr:glycosyltransferase family 39 protein [Terriglobia bacterium]
MQPEITSDREKAGRFFGILLAIAVVDLWILPIRSSFWLDETATFWAIKDGVANLLHRTAEWSGQSPLYYLTAWLALVTGGRQEWVLRLPSLIAMIVAAWLLYKLAARLFDLESARLAVLSFACSWQVAFAASDARPYALGLCLLLGSAWLLVRWLDTGGARYAAGYLLLSVLTIYAHYLFGPIVMVLGVYAVSRALGEGKIKVWQLPAVWIAAGVLMLPLVSQLRHFYQGRAVHTFSGTPQFSDLFASIAPPVLAGSLAVGLLLARLISPEPDRGTAPGRDSVLLAAAWALAPPLLLFTISVLSPVKLFVPRYYTSSMPGLCMLAGWMARSIAGRAGQRIIATVMVVAAILNYGTTSHGNEDWSGAMRKIQSEDGGNMPVLIASSFVEATDPKALDDPRLREVLFAPQEMYPPGGTLIRLPYRLDAESAKYVERILPALDHQDRFVLVVRFEGMTFEPWLRGRLASQGFRSEMLGNFGAVGVFRFSRH